MARAANRRRKAELIPQRHFEVEALLAAIFIRQDEKILAAGQQIDEGARAAITPQIAIRRCTSGKFNVNTAAEKVAVVRFDQRSIEPEAIVVREVQADDTVTAAGAGELYLPLIGLPKGLRPEK